MLTNMILLLEYLKTNINNRILITEVSLSQSNNPIPHQDVHILTHKVLREEWNNMKLDQLEFTTLFKIFTKKNVYLQLE